MHDKRFPHFLQEFVLISDILLWFLAALTPLMFLVGVIAVFDQAAQHRRLLAELSTHGRVIVAEIEQIDFESQRGRITLSYPAENGQQEFAFIHTLEFYPADWLRRLQKGQRLEILYVPSGPYHHAWQAVPLAYYPAIQRNPGITKDVIGLFLFFLAFAMFRPHFLFLGFVPFSDMRIALFTKDSS